MKALRCAVIVLWGAAGSVWISGCSNKFFDPAQVGRYRPTPAVNIILDSLGVAEEPTVAWEEGEEPRPEDIVPEKSDFTLGAGDVLRIGIYELYNDGQWVIDNYVVSETGNVSIPEAGVVNVAGLTEIELEQTIKQKLSPRILRDQPVTVMLLRSQRRTCSVVGDGVARAGRQEIPRHDYRLTDALAAAGGPRQFNVSFVYVSRKPSPTPVQTPRQVPSDTAPQTQPQLEQLDMMGPGMKKVAPKPTASNSEYLRRRFDQPFNQERKLLGMATPSMERLWAASEKVLGNGPRDTWRTGQQPVLVGADFGSQGQELSGAPSQDSPGRSLPGGGQEDAQAQADPNAGIEWVFENGRWVPVSRSRATPAQPSAPAPVTQTPPNTRPQVKTEQPGSIDWIFENGKWVPVPVSPDQRLTQPPRDLSEESGVLPLDKPMSSTDQAWEEAIQTRLIKIPTDRLLAGDPRYNIVIKPGDTIHVPVDIVGEFYIDGNVNKRGPIPITGRSMTLKQAIAAAGGLGPLAYPKKCEVIRRIGRRREEIVLVDLDKIASGEQPDFFIKENDLIRVGTHFSSRWRAVLRNAFRAAYGFGFVYDRNFADAAYGSGWPSWL